MTVRSGLRSSLESGKAHRRTGERSHHDQVFPRAEPFDQVEVHYYHLWKTDCGERATTSMRACHQPCWSVTRAANWNALYWYAAAHEDTVCDASQIARAAAVDAVSRGPRVWISRGKHASFLSDTLCAHGCGRLVCLEMVPLVTPQIINLGELSTPMGGAIWTSSTEWPLATKMSRSDFAEVRTTRVDVLPAANIAWAEPEGDLFRPCSQRKHRSWRGSSWSARHNRRACFSRRGYGDRLGSCLERHQ